MAKFFPASPYRRQAYYAFILTVATMSILSAGMYYGVVRRVIQQDRERIVEGVAGEMKTDIEDQLRIEAVSLKSLQEMEIIDLLLHDKELLQSKRLQLKNYQDLLARLLRKNTDFDLTMLVGPFDKHGKHPVLISSLSHDFRPTVIQYAEDVLPDQSRWLESARTLSEGGKALGWRSIHYLDNIRSLEHSGESHYFVLTCPVLQHEDANTRELIVAVVNWQSFQSVMDQAEALLKRAYLTSGYAFLLGPDGDTVLAHKNQSWIGLKVSTDFNLPQLRDTAVAMTPIERKIEYYELLPRQGEQAGRAAQAIAFGKKFASLTAIEPPSGFEFGDDFKWKLAVGINYDDAIALATRMRLWFWLTPLALAVCVLAVIQYLVKWMRMSLLEFAQLARDTAEGRIGKLQEPIREEQVDQVKDAFNRVLISIRSGIAFTPIPNPYVVGTPIRTNEMFFGRTEDLTWIARQLEARNNLIIGLFGQRRIGKTSLLHQIKHGRATSAVQPILLDTQQFVPGIASDMDFYAAICKYLQHHLMDLQVPNSQLEPSPTTDGINLLLKLLRSVDPNKKPVLLFDEFENLDYKFEVGLLSPDVLLFLGALIEGALPLSLVVTGSNQDSLNSRHWRQLGPKISARRIGLLGRKDAKALITEPLSKVNLLLEPELIPRLLRLGGCHPYYTQLACQVLVDTVNQHQRTVAGRQELHDAKKMLSHSSPPPFIHSWNGLRDPLYKIACASLAQTADNGDEFVTVDRILSSISDPLRDLVKDPVSFRRALQDLCLEDWLESGPGRSYRFRIDLFRPWVRNEHSLDRVAEEVRREVAA